MSDTKRQVLPAGLWVVATPIGNLEDLTPRARLALEAADAVLCEDTRQTAKLMHVLGISKPMSKLERLDAHASERRLESLVNRLEKGESLALVTDAGTPAISDPGAELVALARKSGIAITPVPGVSAVVTLLSVAGFLGTSFAFRGFFPRKNKERAEEWNVASSSRASRIFVWYESPERIAETLSFIASQTPDVEVLAAKELTKLHERFFAGQAPEVLAQVEAELEREGTRGEWCFVVRFSDMEAGPSESESESAGWIKALQCLLDSRISASDAAKRVSQVFGVPKNQVYEAALRISGKKVTEGS